MNDDSTPGTGKVYEAKRLLELDADDLAQPKPIQVAPATTKATGPTINMMTRPPLSKRYMLNPRGNRADVPEWSKREEGFSLRSVGSTGE